MEGAPSTVQDRIARRSGRGGHAPQVGLSRVCWVRIVVSGQHTDCLVGGVAHRRPVVRRVSLATATSLASSGVPTVVRHSSTPRPPAPSPAGKALTDAGHAG